MTAPLLARLPRGAEPDADEVYAAVAGWAADRGLALYPHQDEALIELLSGGNVVLATPTGSGKSLVATGGLFAHLARRSPRAGYWTAPIKALVSEKFFDLCAVLGPQNVGLLTGDASVNPSAPVICCTAEVLANIALREGAAADVGLVVMDEFHFYADPQRGWAWQVPLLELPQAQFLLMSATLGPVELFVDDLTRRTGRETAVVTSVERPVPLSFSWATTPLDETLEELVTTGQAPVYVVHFTQAAAVAHATSLRTLPGLTREARQRIAEAVGDFRFAPGFGRTLSGLLRAGVGVHHAGMLPRYRRLVEQLAQQGLLRVVCGTDTLGVGINVPIRTVLFTGLAKYDGRRSRILRVREFQQIAGRAGRAGFDTVGYVVVQAPEHVIENERLLAKAGEDPKKRRKLQKRKPPEGSVVWTRQTFDKLVQGEPERLVSRMKVDNSMLVNVAARPEDAFAVMRRLMQDNHEERRRQLQLSRRAVRLARSLVASGVLTRLDEPDAHGRRYALAVELPDDFALDKTLSHFALEAAALLDPGDPTHALDLVSIVEAVLDPPWPVLWAQQNARRAEAVAQLKADGVEYDERVRLVEEVTWPQPLADLLTAAFDTYRRVHPWLPEDALTPKSVVREMWEQGMGFGDFVRRYQLSRSEGLLLRHLSDTYRTLRQTVPEAHRTEALAEVVDWLGHTVRQTDSSLLDEWEALAHPSAEPGRAGPPRPAASPPLLSAQRRALHVMVRNAVFRRVVLAARDDVEGLAALERTAAALADPPLDVTMTAAAWDEALAGYYAEHAWIGTDADARGPGFLDVTVEDRTWLVRQTLADPAGHRDWVLDAVVDLDATDAAGEPVVLTTALRRL